jgi:hypothetical protein
MVNLTRAAVKNSLPERQACAYALAAIALGSAMLKSSGRVDDLRLADGAKRASHSDAATRGRLLAAAEGYQVLSSEGRFVGVVDHVRYQAHGDHPDFIIVRRRNAFWRRRLVVPFTSVKAVEPRREVVALAIDAETFHRSPPA